MAHLAPVLSDSGPGFADSGLRFGPIPSVSGLDSAPVAFLAGSIFRIASPLAGSVPADSGSGSYVAGPIPLAAASVPVFAGLAPLDSELRSAGLRSGGL